MQRRITLAFLLVTLGTFARAQTPAAATTITLSTASPVYPGAVLSMSADLAGSAGQNITGVGLSLPSGSTAAAAGAGSMAATKTLWSAGVNMLLIGLTDPAPPDQPIITNLPYSDASLLTFSYPIPAAAAVGSTLQLAPANVFAANLAGSSVALSSPPLTVKVGINPTCTAAIAQNVSAYLASPSIPALGQVVTELVSAAGTGSCT